MSSLIKQFADGSILEFDQGKFDGWCVYLIRPNQPRYAPKDIQYFQQLLDFAKKYSNSTIYSDFVSIFNRTNKKFSDLVLDHISELSKKYLEDSLEIEIVFSIIYAGMIAEENKAFSKLGKRIKRLGIHQLLIEEHQPGEAVNFSRGKHWSYIDRECKKRGF